EMKANGTITNNNDKHESFPPWTIVQLMVFLFLYWAFSQVAGFMFTVAFVLFNKWFGIGLDSHMDVFVGRYLSVLCCLFIFMVFCKESLRRSDYMFVDVWGKIETKRFWVIGAMMLGVLFASTVLHLMKMIYDGTMYPQKVYKINWMIKMVVELGIVAIAVSVAEEILFRGIIFRAILKKHNVYYALVTSSIVFTIYHIPMQMHAPANLIFIFLVGLITSSLFYKTGRLNASIVFHVSYNSTMIILLSK
ncbi:MAG: CPBP family intramembrane metalloprotease, partial [Candidatus Latescibacteria bacterium]|nr:CPBP family intramembrane metalloprotease [Candidatus Latescibacterota bacterium]